MSIGFSQVPADTLVPWTYVEIDDSYGGEEREAFRSLLIGQKLAAGTAPGAEAVPIGDAEGAAGLFGRGSMLHLMAAAFRRQNPTGALLGLALADPTGAPTAPKSVVTVTGAATAAGTAVLYVAGRRITAAVASGDDATAVATALKNAVNDYPDLPATAASAAGVVTVTARQTGVGVDLDVRAAYLATDAQPAGVTLTPVATAGAGDVTLGAALDGVPTERFDIIAHPFTEGTNMSGLETDLEARWNAQVQLDGLAISARRGTYANQGTWASARTSRLSSVMDMSDAPQCDCEWAASVAGAVSLSAASDPALPFQTLELAGIMAPTPAKRRTAAERQSLLGDGMATHTADAGGRVAIERLVTTYNGAKWRDLNTGLQVSFLRRNFRTRIQSKFRRFKLADDDARARPGQKVLRPKDGRAEAISWARDMERLGQIENADLFKEALVVRRNQQDADRLDFLLPPDVINQLRVVAAALQFRE